MALTWTMMVIIPKVRGGYKRIGLEEVIWKVYTLTMNNRLQDATALYDDLHSFR